MPRQPDADQRIAKLLARAGVASRREVERMIAEGRVALDGVPVATPATVLPGLDGVTVDGQPVEAPAAARLFLYHKPAGLLVTERDPGGRPTIYDRLPAGLPRVVPVGRLDLSTEGLLLLTTDGGLKRQLELPATGVERVYRARAYGQVSQDALEDLITGVEIEGVRYGSIDANLERRTGANVWIEMKLAEGKNREVRRVLDHLGLRVSRLIRTAYGPFFLGDLPPGAVAEVRPHDIASFRANPTRRDLPQPPRRSAQRPTPVVAPTDEGPRPTPAGATFDRRRSGAARTVAGARAITDRAGAGPSDAAPVGHPARAARGRAQREATGYRPETAAAKPVRGARASAGRGGPPAAALAKPARAARARAFREASGEVAAPLPEPKRPVRPASKPRPAPPGGRRGPPGKPPRRPGR